MLSELAAGRACDEAVRDRFSTDAVRLMVDWVTAAIASSAMFRSSITVGAIAANSDDPPLFPGTAAVDSIATFKRKTYRVKECEYHFCFSLSCIVHI